MTGDPGPATGCGGRGGSLGGVGDAAAPYPPIRTLRLPRGLARSLAGPGPRNPGQLYPSMAGGGHFTLAPRSPRCRGEGEAWGGRWRGRTPREASHPASPHPPPPVLTSRAPLAVEGGTQGYRPAVESGPLLCGLSLRGWRLRGAARPPPPRLGAGWGQAPADPQRGWSSIACHPEGSAGPPALPACLRWLPALLGL